ncbi:MAG: hypothetical protein ACJAVA_000292 [Flavobacteriaceae bacterium]|jgi:hypothetical protein
MKTELYLIRVYDMVGEKLYTHESLGFFTEEESKEKIKNPHISKESKGFKFSEDGLLPYFANVTEDIPGYLNFEPKTYKNAQLQMQKRGVYFFFTHKEKNDLLIAINSNTYNPI